MPPRGVKSSKRARQYEHIRESARKSGHGTRRAKQIAGATVNKQRREAGETKSARSPGSRKRPGSTRATSGGRTSSTRRSAAASRKAAGSKKK